MPSRAAKLPRTNSPSRNAMTRTNTPRTTSKTKASNANRTQPRTNALASTNTNNNRAATRTTTNNPGTVTGTTVGATTATSPYNYTYGTGSSARNYSARGYGRGYRNRYSGNRGYGRTQGNNRAIVSRLRSVHSTLARLDHDYQGHRVRAMHSISMAIRQLSNQSMVYRNTGFNGMANNNRNRNANGNGANGRQRLTQAQSDARMSQALRTTQGIQMQLASNNTSSRGGSGHARARGHVQQVIRELSTALAVR
jgi:hypothetical protein